MFAWGILSLVGAAVALSVIAVVILQTVGGLLVRDPGPPPPGSPSMLQRFGVCMIPEAYGNGLMIYDDDLRPGDKILWCGQPAMTINADNTVLSSYHLSIQQSNPENARSFFDVVVMASTKGLSPTPCSHNWSLPGLEAAAEVHVPEQFLHKQTDLYVAMTTGRSRDAGDKRIRVQELGSVYVVTRDEYSWRQALEKWQGRCKVGDIPRISLILITCTTLGLLLYRGGLRRVRAYMDFKRPSTPTNRVD